MTDTSSASMKSSHSGLVRFQETLVNFADAYLKPALVAKKLGEHLARPTDASFNSIFYGFTEITNAVDALDLIETLVGLTPPKSRRVNKDEYLKFLIGAYLQEVYILEQRLTAYATKMFRMYKALANLPAVVTEIKDAFGGVVRTRGAHVHEQRYSDQKLDELSSLAFISKFKPEFSDDAHFEYKLAQRDWLLNIKSNNVAAHKFIDIYCDLLFPNMAVSGEFVLPRTGRGRLHAADVKV